MKELEIIKALQEAQEELKKSNDRNEEREMKDLEKFIEEQNNELERMLDNITEDDKKVFDYYVKIVNEDNVTFEELIKDLTDTGIVELIKTITLNYVKHIYAGDFRASGREMKNIVKMYMFMQIYNKNNDYKEMNIEACLYSTIMSAQKEGGER